MLSTHQNLATLLRWVFAEKRFCRSISTIAVLTVSLALNLGCHEKATNDSSNVPLAAGPTMNLAKIDDIEVLMIGWGIESAIDVPDFHYDKERLLASIQKIKWFPESELKVRPPKPESELWRLNLSTNGRQVCELNVIPQQQGHLFYEINSGNYFRSNCWELFLQELIERYSEKWKATLDEIYPWKHGNFTVHLGGDHQ